MALNKNSCNCICTSLLTASSSWSFFGKCRSVFSSRISWNWWYMLRSCSTVTSSFLEWLCDILACCYYLSSVVGIDTKRSGAWVRFLRTAITAQLASFVCLFILLRFRTHNESRQIVPSLYFSHNVSRTPTELITRNSTSRTQTPLPQPMVCKYIYIYI